MRLPVGVNVCCLMMDERTVSQVLIPILNACSKGGKASSSSSTQSCHLDDP